MADVKIVDIDNVQWNMKDQEARNRIATLETAEDITSQVNFLIGSGKVIRCGKIIQVTGTIPMGSGGNVFAVSGLPKAKQETNFIYGVIVYGSGAISYARYESQSIVVNQNTISGGTYTVTYIAE